ncbi:ArsR/SmtB family transcription factor [Bacillus sp. FJAT-45350]|uniref:ArsR/SmtB family transcription factor n=1 Tax=Bacillus sp. FJAT-45350 TaxID=2011014 RepID=UPI000BB77C4C|nr:metalloregulator ArsR/SmtB family transcription factor [Bacillus sp. FJAT-45350]
MQTIDANEDTFERYANAFKALSDPKRLKLMNELCTRGQVCVCDLCDIMELPQSKLSYHLKILMDVDLIKQEKKGKWNYYELNQIQVNHLLSPELCCLFRPTC